MTHQAYHPLPKNMAGDLGWARGESQAAALSDQVGAVTGRLSAIGATIKEVLTFASDVIDFLRALPTFETKTFETRADWPIKSLDVQTAVENVRGVSVVSAFETDDPGATVTATGISWERAEDGLKVKDIGGLTAGTDYTVSVLIWGGR